MPENQIILEFLADTGGIKAAATKMLELGSITREQYSAFIKLNEKNEAQLKAVTKAQDLLTLASKQGNGEAQRLSEAFKNMGQTVVSGSLKEMLQVLQDSGEAMKDLSAAEGIERFKNTISGFASVLTVAKDGTELLGVSTEDLDKTIAGLDTAVKYLDDAQKAATATQTGFNFVVGESTGLMKLFKAGMATLGIGVVILLIDELVEHWDELKEAITGTSKAQRAEDDLLKSTQKGVRDEQAAVGKLVEEYKAESTTKQRRVEIIKQLKETSPGYFGMLNSERSSVEELTEVYGKYVQAVTLKAEADALAKRIAENNLKKSEVETRGIEESLKWYDRAALGLGKLIGGSTEVGTVYYTAGKAAENNAEETKQLNEENTKLSTTLNDVIKKLNELGGDPGKKAGKTLGDLKKDIKGVTQSFEESQLAISEVMKKFADRIKNSEDQQVEPIITEETVEVNKTNADKMAEDIRKSIATTKAENEKAAAEQQEQIKKVAQVAIQIAQEVSDAIFKIQAQNRKADLDAELSKLDAQKDKELSNKHLTEEQKDAINRKFHRIEAAAKLKAWKADQDAAAAQAGIKMALGVVNAWATSSSWVQALIQTAAVLAAGAAEIAVIKSAKPPQFAKGTEYVSLGGNPRGVDTIPAFVNEGERIVPTHINQKLKGIKNEDLPLLLEAYNMPMPAIPALSSFNQTSKQPAMDYNRLGEVLAEKLKANPQTMVNIDKNGIAVHLIEKNRKIESWNNRYKG